MGASLVLTTHPDELLSEPTRAGAGAEAIPAGGDGIAQLCRLLAQDSNAEDPSVVLAVDVAGAVVQRVLEQLKNSA
eukprot:8939663-Lingulodinium_polyedra.AAC.1